MHILMVGLGGALGAILRYLISTLPVKTTFPILTLITNVLGAILIGIVVAFALKHQTSENIVLLLKTGLCGGFTTFSTFSLEALTLFQNKHYGLGILYVFASCILCIGGVLVGERVVG